MPEPAAEVVEVAVDAVDVDAGEVGARGIDGKGRRQHLLVAAGELGISGSPPGCW